MVEFQICFFSLKPIELFEGLKCGIKVKKKKNKS